MVAATVAGGPGLAAEVVANRRRAVGLCVGAGVPPGLVAGVVLGLVLGVVVGLVGALVVVALTAVLVWRESTSLALRVLGAHPPGEEHPRLFNLMEGLCATFGLRVPALMVVDDPVPNACALGHDPARAVLVVTSGLLSHMGLIEMEGLVAHELAHVRCHDTVVSGVAVVVLTPWVRLGGGDGLMHRAVGRGREYRADQAAATAVRYPPGLHDALVALAAGPAPGPDSAFSARRLAATRWLWIDPMVGHRGEALEREIDATPVRLAALAEL